MEKKGTIPPPHEIKVWNFAESRATELESLHSIVAERLDNNFQSQRSKRRRTTGHDNRVAKRKFKKRRCVGGDVDKTDYMRDEKKKSRRVRRNLELKKDDPCGFGTSGDGTKRLRTHVWHAKRFTMTKLWGFYIPLDLHGRGRGSRALLKKLKHGVLVHDASYHSCVQLEGPEDMLLSVLSSVLVLPPSAYCDEISHDVRRGTVFGTAMLHHAGKPACGPIAPVTFMWRPLQHIPSNAERPGLGVVDGEQNIDDGTVVRKMWVWIHAAAFKEACDALRSACERQMDTTSSVNCVSLEGHLAKLELIGSEVLQLLQKTLLPASCCENRWYLQKCLTNERNDQEESKKASILENLNKISSSAVVSLIVKDPRALTKKKTSIVSEGKPLDLPSCEECQIEERTYSSFLEHEAQSVIEYCDLWDVNKGVLPPVEESVLCMEKHHRRKEFIRLGDKSSCFQIASSDEKNSRACPILLLKNDNHKDSVTRYSIILPLSWIKPFWATFMSNGVHAIGLREKHWIAGEIALPFFPLDFPDCNAYSQFMAMEAIKFNDKSNFLPPNKRPTEVPIPPPWNCVHLDFEKEPSKGGNSHNEAKFFSQDEKLDDTIENFVGVAARTSCMLNDYMNNICGDRLLLFPRIHDEKSCLYNLIQAKEFPNQETIISEPKHDKTPCYVRVLLHACKEGVFEQGAVICAPQADDIMLLKARSENDDQQLQISQSLLKSYFRRSQCGKWELQVPEDLTLFKSHRWPIGFITTGFVRGSKKAMAGALCEASLLSKIREEQWKALPVRQRRKEIYVLVRNMRSTAYRLALASIVLEQQDEDVKFW